MSLPKIVIGMPVGSGSIPWPTAVSLLATVRVLDKEKIPFRIEAPVGCSVVTWARNAVAGAFLRSDFTHLFFIDADMVWAPNDFFRLVAFGATHDMIGGAYALKKDPPQCFVNLPGAEGEREVNGFGNVKVTSLGLGFTIIKREVMERLAATKETVTDSLNGMSHPDIFRIGRRPNGGALGEDVAFFEDAAALGYQAWLDPSIKLGHVGQKIYTADVIDALGLNEYVKEEK
jgi:hypothetical protein